MAKQKGIERLKFNKHALDNSRAGVIRKVQELRNKEQTDEVQKEISKLIKSIIHKPNNNE